MEVLNICLSDIDKTKIFTAKNGKKYLSVVVTERKEIEKAIMQMAQWKDEQLKKVCKKCEQHIIDSGRCGCAYRSLAKDYCWED